MMEALAIHGIDNSPRGRVLSAAAHLFRDKGFDRTTVRDIAAMVGIQSGSIFHHFRNKDDILFAVMEEVIRFNTARLQAAVARSNDPHEQLRGLIRAELQSVVGDTAEAMVVLVSEWRCLPQDRQEEALALRAVYEGIWHQVLSALHCNGAFDIDPFVMRRLINGMIGWTPNWFNRDGKLGLDDLADTIMTRVVAPA